ncbi:hypothetical protein PHO31112_01834 [Pandoraea horticolens]|uniref:Uncharacterized protein n=1 Tax=Pandoraea horticolens TaxID=2508298 RepID=A0A5E4U6R2_9BURK|nr:hypothetical protein PHO31112_01834 [Pandoraea horticolens]
MHRKFITESYLLGRTSTQRSIRDVQCLRKKSGLPDDVDECEDVGA